MNSLLKAIDNTRIEVLRQLDPKRKSELGQFMTSATVAQFMASLLSTSNGRTLRLLDAGAGVGSLSCAFLDRCLHEAFTVDGVEVVASEIDDTLCKHLSESLLMYKQRCTFESNVLSGDFIEWAVTTIQAGDARRFTHAILNPPYKKIRSDSQHRLLLRQVGIETVNLYSAFVALTLELMQEGGQIVAIIPRSFCNGLYFRPFRQFILQRATIRHMHLFEARDKAFKEDGVLQENVIIVLERGGQQREVTISTSTDDRFTDYKQHVHHFHTIVVPDDSESFIHIPTSLQKNPIDTSEKIKYSLADLDIHVSTGPVVDFRVKEHLRDMPECDAVPLLYPVHFVRESIDWPKSGIKKPNAMMRNAHTEKWLYPNGFYTVVRRFSAKEEKRRVIAGIVNPATFTSHVLGFENHLNVFHCRKQGLPEELAYGLFAFLNSTVVDDYFRRFNGHTQVNATDLRTLKYPSKSALIELGRSLQASYGKMTQEEIDQKLEDIL